MPRAKIQMSLIGNARDRAKAFARRKPGLLKKAQELAQLCDVDVALVCAGPDGGAPVVWESDPGAVIDRYRRLPAEKRAKHTHLGYIDGQLSKEEGRLDRRRRQGLNRALACPGEAALEGMDLEELLASIDAALLATAERQKALGVADADADDGGCQPGHRVPPDAAVVPPVVGQGAHPPFVGGESDELDEIQAWVDELMCDGGVEPFPLDASMTQPAAAPGVTQYINGGSHQWHAQMPPGNGENHGQLPWDAAYQRNYTTVSAAFPDYGGFQCTPNANAGYGGGGWHDQASRGTDGAIAGNPAYYMPPQHEEHHSMGMGMGIGSFMDAAGGHRHEYGTGCLADCSLQWPDSGQHFGAAEPEPPQYYLSDMVQGISYYDDLQLQAAGGCSSGTGRAQLFAQSHSCCSGTPQLSGSEQSQPDVAHQYLQDPGVVQRFWTMEGPPGSADVATANARARGGGTWANNGGGGHYQPWIPVYQ